VCVCVCVFPSSGLRLTSHFFLLFVLFSAFSLSPQPTTMARMGRVGGKGKGKGKYVVVHNTHHSDSDEEEREEREREEQEHDEQPAGGDRYPSEEKEEAGAAGAADPAAAAADTGEGDAAEAGTSPRRADAAPGEVSGNRRDKEHWPISLSFSPSLPPKTDATPACFTLLSLRGRV